MTVGVACGPLASPYMRLILGRARNGVKYELRVFPLRKGRASDSRTLPLSFGSRMAELKDCLVFLLQDFAYDLDESGWPEGLG